MWWRGGVCLSEPCERVLAVTRTQGWSLRCVWAPGDPNPGRPQGRPVHCVPWIAQPCLPLAFVPGLPCCCSSSLRFAGRHTLGLCDSGSLCSCLSPSRWKSPGWTWAGHTMRLNKVFVIGREGRQEGGVSRGGMGSRSPESGLKVCAETRPPRPFEGHFWANTMSGLRRPGSQGCDYSVWLRLLVSG